MFADVDLRELAEMTSPDRCFLSLYIEAPGSLENMEQGIRKMSKALDSDEAEKNEREHLVENWGMVQRYLARNPIEKGSACIFACWLLDFLQVIPLPVKVSDLVRLDSSPYIRPLAELQDEYENVAVVVADNKVARIFVVSSAVAGDMETVHGNVKNHVRKGGWSQQRYERRRDKQLLHYAREIVQDLQSIENREQINHILLVGGKEMLREIYDNLPQSLQNKTASKRSELHKGDASVNEDIMELLSEVERECESGNWERIRREYLRSGLAVVGIKDVLAAVLEGRVDMMVVCRDFHHTGYRCRECDTLFIEPLEVCTTCNSTSLYEVDAINELVELVIRQSGETDFTDPIDTLVESGSIGALLRYK
ncbi:Vms1/Ankzf1 family peptidyl-tRNA hydrolase [Chloroflexota bacterium]